MDIKLVPEMINLRLFGSLILYIAFFSTFFWIINVINGFIEPKEKSKK